MPSSSEHLDEALVDLAWSQWTELGVRGVARRHQSWSIDPEALLLLTASVAEVDPRLRDESLDWCLSYHRYLSRSRLRNARRDVGEETGAAYERYAATLSAAGARGWQDAGEPWPFVRSSKSELADLRRPALVRIRLRAIFGVSARAEMLHALAWQSPDWTTSMDLAGLACYTKRNVDEELDSLELAGLVEATSRGNRRLVRLADRPTFQRFVGATPKRFPNWVPLVAALTDLRSFVRSTANADDPRVRDVEASRLIDELRARNVMDALPRLPEAGPSAGRRLESWGLRLARHLATGADIDAAGTR